MTSPDIEKYIEETIIDCSNIYLKRVRIQFNNGYSLSVVRGTYSYGGQQGLYEIAPIDLDGNLKGSLLDIEGDDVLGHLTSEQVLEYANKLRELNSPYATLNSPYATLNKTSHGYLTTIIGYP